MKKMFCILGACLLLAAGCVSKSGVDKAAAVPQPQVVEAACGKCLFANKEKKGCNLAVRIDGAVYFVEGFTMKQFGDPDIDDGMCNVIRQAKIAGSITNNFYAATTFDLLPLETE